MRKVPRLLLVTTLTLTGCQHHPNRLTPSGRTVVVEQGKRFCEANPKDSLCSQ